MVVTTAGRLRPVGVALLAGAALAIAILAPGRRGWFDVSVYWGAGNWWRHGGALYDYLHPGTRYGFTYPPFALLCLLPLTLLNWPGAVAVALVGNLACAMVLVHWLVEPLICRHGWPRGYALVIAGSLLAVFGPVRDTISFGQVNLVLLLLVWGDLRRLARAPAPAQRPRSRAWAGVGIGLAAAVKLTPLLFIGYLVVTREWRAARVAGATFVAATVAAALVAPGDSVDYWTGALWHTSRMGDVGYVSNQSVGGLLSRLDLTGLPLHGRWLWPLAVLAVLAGWLLGLRRIAGRRTGEVLPRRPGTAPRVDRPAPEGWLGAPYFPDHPIGFALTGVAACLVSPVSWVHHLVWLLPALLLLLGTGLGTGRRWPVALCAAGYLVLSTGLVWVAQGAPGLLGLLGVNAGVWLSLALLIGLPFAAGSATAARRGGPFVERYAASP